MLLLNPMDSPTRLPQRTEFLQELQLAMADAHALDEPMSLALIQVDRPTTEDALQSHLELLPTVAKVLRLASGRAGTLGHMDDGLFAMLRQHAACEESYRAAQRCRMAIELHFAGRKHPMTVSIGVACRPVGSNWSSRELLHVAAWRCDLAQTFGGNQVQYAGAGAQRNPAGN